MNGRGESVLPLTLAGEGWGEGAASHTATFSQGEKGIRAHSTFHIQQEQRIPMPVFTHIDFDYLEQVVFCHA